MTEAGEGSAKAEIAAHTGDVLGGEYRFRYHEVGAGPVLLCIRSHEILSPTRQLLAERYRVIELQVPDAPPVEIVPAISDGLVALGIERFDLLAHGASAALALRIALDRPKNVRALILLGPTVFTPMGQSATEGDTAMIARLGELNLPNLAVFGTKDAIASPETGRHYRARIPGCNLVFVYDAGHAMERERPEAVSALIFDFLDRHDLFLVRRESDLIYP